MSKLTNSNAYRGVTRNILLGMRPVLRQSVIKDLLPTWEYMLHLEACKCLKMDETNFVNQSACSISTHVLQFCDPRMAKNQSHVGDSI